MGLVAPIAWSSAWALRRKRGKHVPFSSSMWQLAGLSWFGGIIAPLHDNPSLWKPGAAPMTVVDFLSTRSSHGFPFCGHHTLALRGNSAQVWEILLGLDILISPSAPTTDPSHDLLLLGSLAKWVVLVGVAGSAALA